MASRFFSMNSWLIRSSDSCAIRQSRSSKEIFSISSSISANITYEGLSITYGFVWIFGNYNGGGLGELRQKLFDAYNIGRRGGKGVTVVFFECYFYYKYGGIFFNSNDYGV
jgi:hypothetical protein